MLQITVQAILKTWRGQSVRDPGKRLGQGSGMQKSLHADSVEVRSRYKELEDTELEISDT